MKFLAYFVVAFILDALMLLLFGPLTGGWALLALLALPLAMCFYLMDRVKELEEERDVRKRAVELEKEAEKARQVREEEEAQARLEQEMLEQVVAAELAEKAGK